MKKREGALPPPPGLAKRQRLVGQDVVDLTCESPGQGRGLGEAPRPFWGELGGGRPQGFPSSDVEVVAELPPPSRRQPFTQPALPAVSKLSEGDGDADAKLARSLQEEEDKRAAEETACAEARLQQRLDQLAAQEEAADRGGWGDVFGGLLGGRGGAARRHHPSTSAAAAAGLAAAARARGGPSARPNTGPRSSRSRRWAPPSFAELMAGHTMPMGGRFGGMAAMQQALAGASAGLPPHLLFSDRDFTEQDYEQLLALDSGVAKKAAPKEAVEQLATTRVLHRGAAAAAAAAAAAGEGGSAGDSSAPTSCTICLEDFRPGEQLRVLRCACRAGYHKGCIDRWLLHHKNACPMCARAAV